MNRYLNFLLLCIFLQVLGSCASTTYYTPSWVEGIRRGNDRLQVVVNDKLFFRRIAGENAPTKDAACKQTIDYIVQDIKNEYALFPDIPYRVEVLFYDEKHKDCAVTVSVIKKDSDEYDKLKKQNDQFKKIQDQLSQRIKEARDEYEGKARKLSEELDDAKREKEDLERQYANLKNYLNSNARLVNEVNRMQQSANSIEAMLRDRKEKAEMYAYVGLRKSEFEKAIGARVQIGHLRFESQCWERYRLSDVSTHGDVEVCWTEDATIRYYCRISSGECFYNTN